MTLDVGTWSVTGTLAALAIAVGSILLVVYAVRRGLVHRDLDGTIAPEGPDGTMPPDPGRAAAPSRTLGLAGVALLVVGVAIGLLGILTGPAPDGTSATGPGGVPADCARTWNGCPQTTPRP